jgi:hypothetical protein
MGLLDDKKKSQYLQMADDKLQGLLNLRETAQRFMTNPTAFLGLLGQNPLPRESGFAAGATGLPPTEMSVLDPNQAPYMQGYNQGEPVGIAAMALPFAAPAAVATGKALAPKAGQALESYMVNQGLLQPLTAYHGTPHNIQGKFDINKVGTGEGAQAYGHGMYFAESPDVARQYKTALSNIEMTAKGKPLTQFGVDERVVTHSPNIFEKPLDYGLAEYNKSLKTQLLDYPELKNDPNYAKELFDQRIEYLKSWGKGTKEAKAGEALESFAKKNGYPEVNMGGNLYKVDIPDADIPFMLDYDKPFEKQSKEVKEILKSSGIYKQYKDNLSNFSTPMQTRNKNARGENIQAFVEYLAGSPEKATEMLNSLGIKGVRYLDEGSRVKGKGTSNFVVFEPSTVNILEKNKKKVEGLLD